MTLPTRVAVLVLALAAAAGGCTPMRRNEAKGKENLLSAAGFEARPADTPARRELLATLPPLKMVRRLKQGNVVYAYADPYNCKCLYVGSETNYQSYKRLAVERQMAQDELEASTTLQADNPGWSLGWESWPGAWEIN